MDMGQVAKRVSMGKINWYITTHYFMDTDMNLMIPVLAGIY